MAEAIIGNTWTFQVLFMDSLNIPVAVLNPWITVFQYATGAKEVLVSQPMVPSIPAEVGRYVYAYVVPTSFHEGDTIYGEMTGEEPGTGLVSRVEELLTLVYVDHGGYPGLIARFVKGG